MQHQNGDGSWGTVKGLGAQATSTALDAYLNAGIRTGRSYNAALGNLGNAQPGSIDALSRYVRTLNRSGNDVSQATTQLTAARNATLSWGSLPGYGATSADTALALLALLDANPGYTSNDVANALCNSTLPAQRSDGGWSYLAKGGSAPVTTTSSAILPSAYSILLLQKISTTRFTGVTCGATPYTFSTVISNGINFLLTKKNADNGFGENGSSGVLETALAYLAIQSANAANAALAPAQDYLIAQQLNGGWANDPLQTALALQTLPLTTLADLDKDGIPDVVETVLGTNPAVADGRTILPGNGQSVVGVDAPVVMVGATLGQPFNYTISASGGTAPYTFSLVSGQLPNGLTLATSGAISGTPATVGPFSFVYRVSDAQSQAISVVGQIQVAAPATVVAVNNDIPTLPEWGAMILGMLLLGSAVTNARQSRTY